VITATVLATALSTPTPVAAQPTDQLEKSLEGVGVTERLGEPVPPSIELVGARAKTVLFGEHLGAAPVLLSLNYTDCPMLCSMQLAGLAKAIRESDLEPGTDFSVVSVSIDPSESVQTAQHAKKRYLVQAGGRAGLEEAWHFYVASAGQITALADAVGFRYVVDPDTGEYRHSATLIVLTPDGRISRYLHGIRYPKHELAKAITTAKRGEIVSAEEQSTMVGLLLSCFSYDPTSNTPTGLLVMRVGGMITVLALAFLIGVYGFRGRRRTKA